MVADHSLTPDKLRGPLASSLIEYLFTGGIDKQADKLPLPWFPGRGMLINAISRAALMLLLAAAKQELEGTPLEIRIPAEVHYQGRLRTRELSPGMLAAVILADPAVRQCFEATAQVHGVEIRPADDDVMEDADERAQQIKSMLASVQVRLDRLRS
jgi:hypothetical protein